ncbi:MAG TPA: hypothetical protein VEB18_00090 [Candidatus Paceibacterota bacterium]|nr:hypothetical protein [Candidatus Paceibacterota bacterium]
MSAFHERLLKIRDRNRERFRQILEEHVGEVAIFRYDRDSWSAFIGCAVLAGISTQRIADAVGTEPEVVALWLDGALPSSRTEQQRRAIEFITKQMLDPESAS